jgi:hypothetical protein
MLQPDELKVMLNLPVSSNAINYSTITGANNFNAELTGDWLVTNQNADGGFAWACPGASTRNVSGSTAYALVTMYDLTGDSKYLTAMVKAGDYILANPITFIDGDPNFYSFDASLLDHVSRITGDATYSTYVTTHFWDKLGNGTFGTCDCLNENGYVNAKITNPPLANRNNEIWNFIPLVKAALVRNETTMITEIMNGVLTVLNDTQLDHNLVPVGLASAIYLSKITGIDLNPTAGAWAAADSTRDLADLLVSTFQISSADSTNGAFVWQNACDYVGDPTCADSQTTQAAISALTVFDITAYQSSITKAVSFVNSMQRANGSVTLYIGSLEGEAGSCQIAGEALINLNEIWSYGNTY